MAQTDLVKPLRAGVKSNFPCPNCGAKTGVRDSRPSIEIYGIRRRRRCFACEHRFTTMEVAYEKAGGVDVERKNRVLDRMNALLNIVNALRNDVRHYITPGL